MMVKVVDVMYEIFRVYCEVLLPKVVARQKISLYD